jgi:hypothetical protein
MTLPSAPSARRASGGRRCHPRSASRTKVAFLVASTALAALAPSRANAAPMDITPERLFTQPPGLSSLPGNWDCQKIQGIVPGMAPSTQASISYPQQFYAMTGQSPNLYPCLPNNAAWANLMSELGYAIAPSAFRPARTTGFGGFALSLEASFAHINADASAGGQQYWHAGTQGNPDPSTNTFSPSNSGPDSILQIYTLKARKGLGYGFEVTGALGYLANTSLWVGGADVHWAVLEGYRTGILGYLPDIAVGGGVRTLGGSPKFFLTTVGIDAQVSKPFALADSAVLTPYIGGQRLLIFADSTIVNLTPNVDPLAQCGYQGPNIPTNPSMNPRKGPPWDGQPLCANSLQPGAAPSAQFPPNNSDFNNQVTFAKLRAHRWRGLASVTYRYELLYLAGQFAMDLEDPGGEGNAGAAGDKITGDKQWTVSIEAGVFF